MTRLATFVLCLATLAVGSPAHAGDAPDAAAETTDTHTAPVDLELAGFVAGNGPAGDLGVEAQLGIGRYLALAAGYGFQMWGSAQTAVQVRARLPLGAFTLYAGLGGARGVLRVDSPWFDFCGDDSGCQTPPHPPSSTTPADFATIELGVEARAWIVFARLFAGEKVLLNADAACGYEQECNAEVGFVGAAAGLHF